MHVPLSYAFRGEETRLGAPQHAFSARRDLAENRDRCGMTRMFDYKTTARIRKKLVNKFTEAQERYETKKEGKSRNTR